MTAFGYNPAAVPDYAHQIGLFSGQLEDVRSQAQNVLQSVLPVFQGQGGMSFEHAQMLINSGIDAGKEVLLRHSTTVGHVWDETCNTDIACGNSFGG